MKKIFLAFLVLGSFWSALVEAADACGKNTIKYYSKPKMELVNVIDKPEKDAAGNSIRGKAKVMVSGIYMFVRNGQTWNIYRCADGVTRDEAGVPLLNLNNCVLKNDFQSGSLVKRFGSSGIKVEGISEPRLIVRLNAGGDPDYYEVRDTATGLEVTQQVYKENKEQPWNSRHWPTSLGICRYDGSNDSSGSAGGSKRNTPAQKVNQNR